MVVKRLLPLLVAVGLLASAGSAAGMSYRPSGISASDTPLEAATALVEQRPDLVGGASATRIDIASEVSGAADTTIVRFDQSVRGVPILGGDVVVAVDEANHVVATNGDALDGPLPSLTAGITADQAAAIATAPLTGDGVQVGNPELALYDPTLVGRPGPPGATLVWTVEVQQGSLVRRRVFVDAQTGAIVATLEEIEHALDRVVCDAGGVRLAKVPCRDADAARTELGPSGTGDVETAFANAGITHAFYNALGRDSINGAGMTIRSTVNYCPAANDSSGSACPYNNAYWDGSQMVYGAGYASADDVVAHELTHGVTDYTSGLYYWYQSGAINEALSDIMGEFVDLENPASAVLPNVDANRWLMGEDLGLDYCRVGDYRVIRDMRNPPSCGDPDRVSSALYRTGSGDSGGVHTNSGIVNKTAYLIADGDTFNRHTVQGIGLAKSARLWYQTALLLRSGSSFADLATTLQQACTTLIGSEGFVTDDCAQVAEATAATELAASSARSIRPAAVCAAGTQTSLFADGFENGVDGTWTKDNATPSNSDGGWWYSSETNPFSADVRYAMSGSENIWANDPPGVSDTRFAMSRAVALPSGAFLRFAHADGFETSGTAALAGGIVEYSLEGGAWTNASSLPAINGSTGVVAAGHGNPLAGQLAFVGHSGGYTATRFDLSSLAGHSVRFRFRVGTGSGGSSLGDSGWYVDDVAVYTCAVPATDPPSVPMLPAATPATTSPRATGSWSINAATNLIRVRFAYQSGTTYAIRATRRGVVRTGTCRRAGATITCAVRAPNGKWRVVITPKTSGRTGKAIIRTVRT